MSGEDNNIVTGMTVHNAEPYDKFTDPEWCLTYGISEIKDAKGNLIQFPYLVDYRDFCFRSKMLQRCSYILVSGTPEVNEKGKAYYDSTTAHFSIIPEVFMETLKDYYKLSFRKHQWAENGNNIDANAVKGYVQNALIHFGDKTREKTQYYNDLRTYCAVNLRNEKPRLNIVTAKELAEKEYKRPPFLIDRIFPVGVVTLAAPPKTGKSFMSIDLACSVAEGKPFWGLNTKQGDVLYLDLEGVEWRTKDRINKVNNGNIPARLNHVYNCDTLDNGLIDQLQQWVEEAENPKLIIIDTLQHIRGMSNKYENAYGADTRTVAPIHEFAMKNQVGVLLVTHTKKANGYSDIDDPFELITGSQAVFGNSDTAWLITGKRNEKRKKFSCQSRDGETLSFEIEQGEGGKWTSYGSTEQIRAKETEEAYYADYIACTIKENITKAGGRWQASANDIINAVAEMFGEYPEPDATRMSIRVRSLAEQLTRYDNILVKFPDKNGGKGGRKFTFEQTPMA